MNSQTVLPIQKFGEPQGKEPLSITRDRRAMIEFGLPEDRTLGFSGGTEKEKRLGLAP